jgi:hypothetical protein
MNTTEGTDLQNRIAEAIESKLSELMEGSNTSSLSLTG